MCATQTKESAEWVTDLSVELAALQAMSIPALQQQYHALFGRPASTNHRASLLRRLAWELQARRAGGLSAEATGRMAELADAINPLTYLMEGIQRRLGDPRYRLSEETAVRPQ